MFIKVAKDVQFHQLKSALNPNLSTGQSSDIISESPVRRRAVFGVRVK
jgi:hypothetical protein